MCVLLACLFFIIKAFHFFFLFFSRGFFSFEETRYWIVRGASTKVSSHGKQCLIHSPRETKQKKNIRNKENSFMQTGNLFWFVFDNPMISNSQSSDTRFLWAKLASWLALLCVDGEKKKLLSLSSRANVEHSVPVLDPSKAKKIIQKIYSKSFFDVFFRAWFGVWLHHRIAELKSHRFSTPKRETRKKNIYSSLLRRLTFLVLKSSHHTQARERDCCGAIK